MKFGKFLEEKSKAEWRLYYVDYKYLKRVIKTMSSEIENQNQSKKELENKFTKSIELEINKVNDFFLMIEKEIQGKLTSLRQLLNKTVGVFIKSKNILVLINFFLFFLFFIFFF